MNWMIRCAQNIFPFSVSKSDLAQALKEWLYTGDMFDLEHPVEDCELCDHPDIRYQFKKGKEGKGTVPFRGTGLTEK